MATIGSLLINLTTNSAAFASGMAANASTVSKFAADIGAAGLQVAKFGAGLAAVGATAAVGGLALLTKQAMDTIDTTAKVSDQLGIATEKMAALQFAADLAGVSNEELAGTLGKMVKNLGDAAMKGGPMADALASMGLSAEQLANAGTYRALEQIADGLAGVQNSAQRASLATAVFGRQGLAMVSVLQQGSAGLREAAAQADALGITFSRVDAAQVEAANDSLTVMGYLFKGIGQTLAVEVAPFITAAVQKMTELGASGLGSGKLVTNAFEWMVGAVSKATDYLALFQAGWYGLKAGVLQVTAEITGVLQPWAEELLAILKHPFLALNAPIMDFLELMIDLNKKTTFGAKTDFFGITEADIAQRREEIAKLFSPDESASAFMTNLQQAAQDSAAQAAQAYENAMQRFTDGANARETKKFFDDIRSRAEQSAQTIAGLSGMNPAIDPAVAEDSAKRMKSMQRAAESMFAATRTPLEKMSAEILKARELFESKLIDSDTLQRAESMARDNFAKTLGGDQFESSLASQKLQAMDAGFLTRSPATDRTAEVQQQQKMLQQQMAAALASIDSKTGVDVSVPWN